VPRRMISIMGKEPFYRWFRQRPATRVPEPARAAISPSHRSFS
jgi:hypothetical protein